MVNGCGNDEHVRRGVRQCLKIVTQDVFDENVSPSPTEVVPIFTSFIIAFISLSDITSDASPTTYAFFQLSLQNNASATELSYYFETNSLIAY